MNYLRSYATRSTPQSEAIPGSTQVENSAGGFAWEVDHWTRLRRFLILGSEGGSYYASERKLTHESAEAVRLCLADDGPQTVAEILAVSIAGRAPKNDPAIFALAMAAAAPDPPTRRAALNALPEVCRIGTHLFHFAQYVEQFRGWGRALRRAVGAWYERPVDALAYQAVKYRQRDGWTHRDLLRLAHPEAPSREHRALYDWICGRAAPEDGLIPLVDAYEAVNGGISTKQIAEIAAYYKLPREALPSDSLTDPKVWEALLEDMPMTAMIRNLATMTRVGVVAPMSAGTTKVLAQLGDAERLRKARVHPIAVLAALVTYQSGYSARGSSTWSPVPQVVDALDAAFYEAFGNVEPSNKRTMLALDVSGSMSGGEVAGIPGISPRVGSAAMALITAATEPAHMFAAFSTQFVQLSISPRQRLDDVVRTVSGLPFAGTDCALPMLAARESGLEIDTFVVYTDSETWHGRIHPSQALTAYREATGIPARLVVVGMVGNQFTIADPNDPGMLDVVGFDTAAPEVMAAFARGEL